MPAPQLAERVIGVCRHGLVAASKRLVQQVLMPSSLAERRARATPRRRRLLTAVRPPLGCAGVKEGLADFGQRGFCVPEESRRGTRRASRLMIDVLHAVAACDGLIHYWDVAKQPGGTVLLRASSVRFFPSEEEAVRVAHGIAERIPPAGYDAHTVTAVARTNGVVSDGWHAFVEVLIGARVGTGTR